MATLMDDGVAGKMAVRLSFHIATATRPAISITAGIHFIATLDQCPRTPDTHS